MADAHRVKGDPAAAIAEASRSLSMLERTGYGSGQARARLVHAQALLDVDDASAAEPEARFAFQYYRRERIYPHLWREALDTWQRRHAGSVLPDGTGYEDLLAEIPHLDQIGQTPLGSDTTDE